MFRDKLKLLRTRHKMTQGEVAQRINIERSSIAKYEGAQGVMPSADVLLKLADLFNVSTDYLLDREIIAQGAGNDNLVMLTHGGKRNIFRIPGEKMPVLYEIISALAEKE